MAPRAQFALDTNVLSEATRPIPDDGIIANLRRFEDAIAIPAPVLQELVYGVQRMPRSRRRSALERFLDDVVLATFPILPYDELAAAWHGRERARLEARGTRPPFVDGQIASIAAVQDLTLVTNNARDFERFEGLRVADWRARPSR